MIRRPALLLLALLSLTGCASLTSGVGAEPPRPPVARPLVPDLTAEAYYHFTAAQLHAQAGRLKDAIAEIREAIKRDPTTPSLWTQLAVWL